jgi:hypothetical protein
MTLKWLCTIIPKGKILIMPWVLILYQICLISDIDGLNIVLLSNPERKGGVIERAEAETLKNEEQSKAIDIEALQNEFETERHRNGQSQSAILLTQFGSVQKCNLLSRR